MVSSPSAPAAPNPQATASAQTASNQQTALYQAGLNDVNQNTPLGNISYTINPTGNAGSGATFDTKAYEDALSAWQAANANSKNPNTDNEPTLSQFQTSPGTAATPSTTSNITLNPEVQTALDEYLQTAGGTGQIANNYISQVQGGLQQPFNYEQNIGKVPVANTDMLNRTVAQEEAALQPEINMQREQQDAKLANQGITPGSEAYNNEMYTFNAGQNNLQQQIAANAEQQMAQNYADLLSGNQQAATQYASQYTMPLNELSGLHSGTQVGTPQFNAPPAAGVSPTNVAGITNQSYQDQLGVYNSQVGQQNQLMDSLFGLGGTLGGAYMLAPAMAA